MHRTARRRALAVAAAALVPVAGLGAAGTPAGAAGSDHGGRIVAETPARGTPHVMNGAVLAITQVGGTVVVGGTFTSVSPSGTFADRSDDLVRNRLFAFDAATGVIDPAFDPDMGGEVRSLDTDGTHVYAAGAFGSVGGRPAFKRVVRLTMAGAPTAEFKAVPSAVVNDVVVRGSRLYVGGAFVNVKSRTTTYPVDRLAVLDALRGTPDLTAMNLDWSGVYNPSAPRPGTTNVKRFDVTPDGTRLAAVGNFTTISGRTRNQLAVLDVGGPRAALTSFATDRFARSRSVCSGSFDTFTRDVDFSPDGDFFVVTTTGAFGGGAAAGTLCDTSSRWETRQTGNDPTWVGYTGGDTTYGVAVTGDVVYLGGHMRWQNNPFQGDQAGPGAVAREGIAAVDAVNGVPLTWNPGRDRGVGAQALFATPQGLWVGSDTTLLDNQRRGRIAFLPLAGGGSMPSVAGAQLPSTLHGFHQGFLQPTTYVRHGVDASGRPTGPRTTLDGTDWSTVRGAFVIGRTLYHGTSGNELHRRSFDPGTGALGPPTALDLHDDPDDGARIPWLISSMTGMFFDPETHRIYYTVAGDSRLFFRGFSPQSQIVGAQAFTADTGGTSLAGVAGLTLAGGRVLYGSTDGALRSAPFGGGRITGPPTVLSNDGTWRFAGLFVPAG